MVILWNINSYLLLDFFSVTWSFRNSSNADVVLNKYLLLSMLKSVVLLNIFVEIDYYFKILWSIEIALI